MYDIYYIGVVVSDVRHISILLNLVKTRQDRPKQYTINKIVEVHVLTV